MVASMLIRQLMSMLFLDEGRDWRVVIGMAMGWNGMGKRPRRKPVLRSAAEKELAY